MRDEDGARYTGKRIAEKANDLGYSLSDAYISQLRSGKARTPSFRTVEAIARAFEVSVTYFLANPEEDYDRTRQQQNYVEMLAVTGTHLSGVDLGNLCPSTIDVLIDLLRVVKAQALAAGADDGPDSGGGPGGGADFIGPTRAAADSSGESSARAAGRATPRRVFGGSSPA
ncbi:hypothetical protein GCM10009624_00930 [Gordonia sinesedis]